MLLLINFRNCSRGLALSFMILSAGAGRANAHESIDSNICPLFSQAPEPQIILREKNLKPSGWASENLVRHSDNRIRDVNLRYSVITDPNGGGVYALYSGEFGFNSGKYRIPYVVDIGISHLGLLEEKVWSATGEVSEFARNEDASNDPGAVLISTAIYYLEYGYNLKQYINGNISDKCHLDGSMGGNIIASLYVKCNVELENGYIGRRNIKNAKLYKRGDLYYIMHKSDVHRYSRIDFKRDSIFVGYCR